MKIALVTNKKPHHLHWAISLYKEFDVKCIIHPAELSSKKKLDQVKDLGITWTALRILSKIYRKFSKNSLNKLNALNEQKFFGNSVKEYNTIPKDIIHNLLTVNSNEAIELIKQHDIDVLCFLGGDVARSEFINSANRTCLNLHSGLSPFYNGCSSLTWSVCENRPNFAGVTLMYMNERIDGGHIISHFLPEINEDDNASTLFMKGIIGGTQLYINALNRLIENQIVLGSEQHRSIRYTKCSDWTIYQDLRLAKFHKSKRMKIYSRKSSIIDYSEIPNQDLTFKRTLNQILMKQKP